MQTINLAEQYDEQPLEWDGVRGLLDAGLDTGPGSGGPGRYTCWLSSVNADGSPHVNAIGAIWEDGGFWFVTGRSTRRGRNVDREPRCALAISTDEFDLVIEGNAVLVTEPEVVTRIARRYNDDAGWPCEVAESGTALTAAYSAQSAGRPPWHIYRIDATSAHVVRVAEPYGATRWRF